MATMPSVLTSLKSILTITSTMAALQKITMMTCLPLLHVADAAHSSLPASITTAFHGKPPATAFQARPLSRPSCLQELRCRSQSDSALSLFSSSSRGGKFGRALRQRIGTKSSKWNINRRLFVSSPENDSNDNKSDNTNSITNANTNSNLLIDNVNGDNDNRKGSIVSNEKKLLHQLQKQNQLLHERLKLLQLRNDELLEEQQRLIAQQQHQQRHDGKGMSDTTKAYIEQRLILEDFEGEGLPQMDARGNWVDGWDREKKKYTEPWDEDEELEVEISKTDSSAFGTYPKGGIDEDDDELGLTVPSDGTDEEDDDELGLSPSAALTQTAQQQQQKIQQKQLTQSDSDVDDEICEYNEESQNWGECPVEPNISFKDAMKSRAYWLVGLLALQSCSGFILSRNEMLLQDHPVIIYFLTMLVGAGGNAGNQASVRVIRGLALGTLNPQTQSQFLSRELRMAISLSFILSLAGFLRATLFQTPFPETMAVTLALSLIVFSSICLGAVLPLLLQKLGVDPAHSSTTIQVVMDILGVVLTVFVSTAVLDSPWGKLLVKGLSNWGL